MKKSGTTRILALLISVAIILSLVGCGSVPNEQPSTITETSDSTSTQATEPTTTTTSTTVTTSTKPTEYSDSLTDQQKNSYSMLCYLAITAENIRTSKNNRLILEDIYTSLLNDINPGKIDERTQAHLRNLQDIINSYMNISVKRERLQYIYNQKKSGVYS